MNHFLPVILLNPPKKGKNDRNLAAKQQKCPKIDIFFVKFMMQTAVHWFVVFNSFLCSILEVSIEIINKVGIKLL